MEAARKVIAALKAFGRWIWVVVLAVITVTAVFRSRAANDRAEKAHDRLRKAAVSNADDRWKTIDRHLKAADRAEDTAKKRKANATQALDAISAKDPDMERLLNRYNSRRVRERPDPADVGG